MGDGELPRDTRCVLEPLCSVLKNLCTFNNALAKKNTNHKKSGQ